MVRSLQDQYDEETHRQARQLRAAFLASMAELDQFTSRRGASPEDQVIAAMSVAASVAGQARAFVAALLSGLPPDHPAHGAFTRAQADHYEYAMAELRALAAPPAGGEVAGR